jgi:hypothetical protein
VQTLVTALGRTLVVVEFVPQPDDPCLAGKSLRAAAVDYRFLPLALNGQNPASAPDRRLKPDDRVTAVAELPDLERLLRREPVPRDRWVVVDGFPKTAREALLPLVRAARRCSQDEADAVLGAPPFVAAAALTRGEADELLAQLGRERVSARVEATCGLSVPAVGVEPTTARLEALPQLPKAP